MEELMNLDALVSAFDCDDSFGSYGSFADYPSISPTQAVPLTNTPTSAMESPTITPSESPTPSPSGTPTDSCEDGAQTGDETDIDCGGSCMGCAMDMACHHHDDCLSGHCTANTCTTAAPTIFPTYIPLSHSNSPTMMPTQFSENSAPSSRQLGLSFSMLLVVALPSLCLF